MANCSIVEGTITLVGDWTDEMLVCMNIVKDRWASWTYNIDPDFDFSADRLSQSFCGCGRWSFNSNLRELDAWTKDEATSDSELELSYKKLTAEMQLRDCFIDFAYSDEENGNRLLRDGTARFRAVNNALIGSISEHDFDFGWKDYIN